MSPQSDRIRIVNGFDENAYTYYPILIVGAGESGIALGSRLREEGIDQFRIFERQAGIGGTWWINRYPGVACDVPAAFYSFSFSPNLKWTSLHPGGAEIYQYFNDTCEKYQFVDKIQLNTDVSELRWLEDEQLWEATLTHLVPGTGDLSKQDRNQRMAEKGRDSVYLRQEIVRARIVCCCAGGLVEPNPWPSSIPGRDTFEGPIFHSARWEHKVDFKDKNVIVIGTGCSAAQFVPRLTQEPYNAESVTQIMRSPPWVVPRAEHPGGKDKYEKYSPKVFSMVPGLAKLFRIMCFATGEYHWFTIFDPNSWNHITRGQLESRMIARMKGIVPEKYHEILTPDYSIGCKRRIFDAQWLPSLNDPKIELTTKPITKVSSNSVTIGPGRVYPDPANTDSKVPTNEETIPADVIVLGNGFEATAWLHPLKIRGKGGVYMQDVWDERGGPQAYLGLAVDGFPNLFIVFGPNTATGHSSVILASENMVEYNMKLIKKIIQGDATTIEVKKEAEMAWTKIVQDRLKLTVFNAGCQNWYQNDGWNSTAYPYSQIDFTFRCMFPKWSDWEVQYTRKGLLKRQARQALKSSLTALPGNCALFEGHLDIDTLGGAGFASQLQSAALSTGVEDAAWDLSIYNGIELDVGPGDRKIYTFIFKDELLEDKRDDGRDKAGINWEADFSLSTDNGVTTQEGIQGKKIWIPWEALKATFRGKEKSNARKFDPAEIRRIGIMMRSYFGTQRGDFRLELRSISARTCPSTSAEVSRTQ
ncbi:MAG: hypothetical protein LQ352_001785 [Teloschistes flavicans]|nr:MAG: hypothetical protein LQ352_001785 [Teloschistes flavicans]